MYIRIFIYYAKKKLNNFKMKTKFTDIPIIIILFIFLIPYNI